MRYYSISIIIMMLELYKVTTFMTSSALKDSDTGFVSPELILIRRRGLSAWLIPNNYIFGFKGIVQRILRGVNNKLK